jgi:hypothetical protein
MAWVGVDAAAAGDVLGDACIANRHIRRGGAAVLGTMGVTSRCSMSWRASAVEGIVPETAGGGALHTDFAAPNTSNTAQAYREAHYDGILEALLHLREYVVAENANGAALRSDFDAPTINENLAIARDIA